jgi:CBS domain-containing protein
MPHPCGNVGATSPSAPAAATANREIQGWRTDLLVRDVLVRRPTIVGPSATVRDALAFFEDTHVHMALVVDHVGTLITAIERSDLAGRVELDAPLSAVGTLRGRVVSPDAPVAAVVGGMLRSGRRRLAVVDDQHRLVGLLCLNRRGDGFCSDEGIARRRAPSGERRS